MKYNKYTIERNLPIESNHNFQSLKEIIFFQNLGGPLIN